MADKPIPFQDFLQEEVARVKSVYYPVRAGFLQRVFKRQARPQSLHPNPDDIFCDPKIGPNFGIINGYADDYRQPFLPKYSFKQDSLREPIMVHKARPDGYLILNGHHRWAAATQVGIPKVKIRIVNLTREKDIHDMLSRSRTDRRVTLDLDEVVFCSPEDSFAEPHFRFPVRCFYKERVRLGVPALFHYLIQNGYDIWVYTSKLYSMEYIRFYFRHWNVRLAGIVTGAGRKVAGSSAFGDELKKKMETHYRSTMHIDGNAVTRTFSGRKEIEEYPLSGSAETWSREVMDVIEKLPAAQDGVR